MTAINARRDLFMVFLVCGIERYAGSAFVFARESDSDFS